MKTTTLALGVAVLIGTTLAAPINTQSSSAIEASMLNTSEATTVIDATNLDATNVETTTIDTTVIDRAPIHQRRPPHIVGDPPPAPASAPPTPETQDQAQDEDEDDNQDDNQDDADPDTDADEHDIPTLWLPHPSYHKTAHIPPSVKILLSSSSSSPRSPPPAPRSACISFTPEELAWIAAHPALRDALRPCETGELYAENRPAVEEVHVGACREGHIGC